MTLMEGNTNQNCSCKKWGYGVDIGCEEKYVSRNVINSFIYKCFLILQFNQEVMLCICSVFLYPKYVMPILQVLEQFLTANNALAVLGTSLMQGDSSCQKCLRFTKFTGKQNFVYYETYLMQGDSSCQKCLRFTKVTDH